MNMSDVPIAALIRNVNPPLPQPSPEPETGEERQRNWWDK